jgi:hypothetical protein
MNAPDVPGRSSLGSPGPANTPAETAAPAPKGMAGRGLGTGRVKRPGGGPCMPLLPPLLVPPPPPPLLLLLVLVLLLLLLLLLLRLLLRLLLLLLLWACWGEVGCG